MALDLGIHAESTKYTSLQESGVQTQVFFFRCFMLHACSFSAHNHQTVLTATQRSPLVSRVFTEEWGFP